MISESYRAIDDAQNAMLDLITIMGNYKRNLPGSQKALEDALDLCIPILEEVEMKIYKEPAN